MKLNEIKESLGGDKGFILILALVTMLAMTLIGLSVVMNMTTDMQLARNDREAKLAFQVAEAGIKEAVARLHLASAKPQYIGEKSTDANYRTTTWAGHSFTRVDPDLNYDVTIRYLDETNHEGFCDDNETPNNTSATAHVPPTGCSNANEEVVMFGQDFNLSSAVTSIQYGRLPVYRVHSVGTSHGTTRTIEAYLGASNLNTDTDKAINTNSCVTVAGSANNVAGSVVQGAGCGCDPQLAGGCSPNKTTATGMDTYLGDTLANVKGYADETHSCTTNNCGGPGDDIPSSGALEGVVTNWGTPDASRFIYVNNGGAGKEVSISGNLVGTGILLVTGDLSITGSVTWNGLIYVMGKLKLGGGGNNVNVNGGIMAGDMSMSTVGLNGNVTVNYNYDMLQEVSRQLSSSSIIVWKRL